MRIFWRAWPMAMRGKPMAAAPASAARRDSLVIVFPPCVGADRTALLSLDASGLDQLAVLLELADHERVEFLRRVRRGIGADLGQPLLDLGHGKHLRQG